MIPDQYLWATVPWSVKINLLPISLIFTIFLGAKKNSKLKNRNNKPNMINNSILTPHKSLFFYSVTYMK